MVTYNHILVIRRTIRHLSGMLNAAHQRVCVPFRNGSRSLNAHCSRTPPCNHLLVLLDPDMLLLKQKYVCFKLSVEVLRKLI